MTDYEKRIKELEERMKNLEEKINGYEKTISELIQSNNNLSNQIKMFLESMSKNDLNLEENNEQEIDHKTINFADEAVDELDAQVKDLTKDGQDNNYYSYRLTIDNDNDLEEEKNNNYDTLEEDNNQNDEDDEVDINNPSVRSTFEKAYNLKHNNIISINANDDDELSLDNTENDYLGNRVELKFDSLEDEKKNLQPEDDIDYTKTKGKKSSKLKNIRKSFNFEKIKSGIKKHWKKVVATVLAATAALSAVVAFSVNDNNAKDNNNTSVIQEIGSDIPSKSVANEFGINTDDLLNKFNLNNQQKQVQDEPSTNVTNDDADYEVNAIEEKNTNDNYSIGQEVKFTGDYIYQTSKDASDENNKLNPDYPNDDKRSISAIQMVSPDGIQHITITDNNKEEQDLLESMGWTVESYNLSNDNENIKYEGWRNNSDLEVSNGNHR